jgi:hypothetical protein
MRSPAFAVLVGICCATALAACSSSPATTSAGGGSTHGTGGVITGAGGAGTGGVGTGGAGTGGAGASDAGPDTGEPPEGGADADAAGPPVDSLDANRDRLLATYLDYLKANAAQPQSNGLSGSNVSTVCDVWSKLAPSAQAVFLTLTARLQGSILGDDGSSMLSHVTKVYRIAGGQNATATDPGSCGGGEYNRMIMSMDAHLSGALRAANQHKGAVQSNGKPDIADIPASSFWRDSHDLGGPHAPFDLSDETEQGAPRGQAQYFADPASALAGSPLGRMDLTSLVDPYALEMDQDYDCVHNSNPSCTYITYGPLCFPQPSALGTDIYAETYGSIEPGWHPSGCGP